MPARTPHHHRRPFLTALPLVAALSGGADAFHAQQDQNVSRIAARATTAVVEIRAFDATGALGTGSGVRNLEGQVPLQITAPISHGSSGEPVLNRHGEVVGVSGMLLASGQNLNFTVPATTRASSPPGQIAFPAARIVTDTLTRVSPVAAERQCSGGTAAATMLHIGAAATEGCLEEGDMRGGDRNVLFDLFLLRGGRAGQTLTIDVMSADFKPVLILTQREMSDLVGSDISGEGTNARLTVTLPATSTYGVIVRASNARDKGHYVITAREGAPAPHEIDGLDPQRWLNVYDADDRRIYIDMNTVQRVRSGVFLVWDNTKYSEVQTSNLDGRRHDGTLMRTEIDCTGRRFRPHDHIRYLDGKMVAQADPRPGNWYPVLPETVGEAHLENTCAALLKK